MPKPKAAYPVPSAYATPMEILKSWTIGSLIGGSLGLLFWIIASYAILRLGVAILITMVVIPFLSSLFTE